MSKSISRFTESELQRLEEAGVINGELRQQIQAFYQKEVEAANYLQARLKEKTGLEFAIAKDDTVHPYFGEKAICVGAGMRRRTKSISLRRGISRQKQSLRR